MDILVSVNDKKTYYNFWAAEKRDGKVYLYELYKTIVKKYALGGRTSIRPEEKIINRAFEKVLVRNGDRYFIDCGEIIERYDSSKEYINVFIQR